VQLILACFSEPNPPVVITSPPPPGRRVAASVSTATLGDCAIGPPPFGYQWRYNGIAISGATNATHSRTNVPGTMESIIPVVITNTYGAATSSRGAHRERRLDRRPTKSTSCRNHSWVTNSRARFWARLRGVALRWFAWPRGSGFSLGYNPTPPTSIPNRFRTPSRFATTLAKSRFDGSIFRLICEFTNAGGSARSPPNVLDLRRAWYLTAANWREFEWESTAITTAFPGHNPNSEGPRMFSPSRPPRNLSFATMCCCLNPQTSAGAATNPAFGMTLVATVSTTNHPVHLRPLLPDQSCSGRCISVLQGGFIPWNQFGTGNELDPLNPVYHTTGQTFFTDLGRPLPFAPAFNLSRPIDALSCFSLPSPRGRGEGWGEGDF